MSGLVKLLLSYDILAENEDSYFRYVTGHFVPQAREMGLELTEVWHTAYGEHPTRLIAFVAKDLATAKQALTSEQWLTLEKRLQNYVTNYDRRLVSYREHFQF